MKGNRIGLLRIVMIILGAAAVTDSIVLLFYSHINFGTLYPAVVGLPLLIMGLLYKPLLPLLNIPFVKWILIAAYSLSTLFILVMSILMLKNAGDKPPKNADAIIVLGCASRYNKPSLTLKNRLDAAIAYMQENTDTIAVLSGGVDEGASRSEAAIMYDYMVSQGISDDRLLKEEKATSTQENFIFSMDIVRKEIGENSTVVFATTRFHVYRAELTAKKLNISAVGIPADGAWITTVNDYIRESFVLVNYWMYGKI